MATLLIVLTVALSGAPTPMCSVGPLRSNPEGYFWPLHDIRGFVKQADAVVRVRALGLASERAMSREFGFPDTQVNFEIIETLKSDSALHNFVAVGVVVDRDDFNKGSVPYRIVRPSGQRGDCFAKDYKRGAEYLLLLRRRSGTLTPYWAALAPLNEQIHGMDDPWLDWVRSEL